MEHIYIRRHPVKSPPMCGRCALRAARWLVQYANDEQDLTVPVIRFEAAVCDECLQPDERLVLMEPQT